MTSACRARYLGLLTVSQIATVHGSRSTGQPFDDALDRHIDDLNSVRGTLDRLDDPSLLANAIAMLKSSDILGAIAFWRLFKSAIVAARQAEASSATVCAISDRAISPLAEVCDHLLVVLADGSSFPSMVPSLAIVDGIIAEFGTFDPGKTRNSIAIAEAQAQAFDFLHYNAKGTEATQRDAVRPEHAVRSR